MSHAGRGVLLGLARLFPLLGVLLFVPGLPALAEAPLTGVMLLPWRFDLLTLIFSLSCATAVAVVPLPPRAALLALALAALLLAALLLEHILALPAALLLCALALRSRRGVLAAVLLGGALLWPYATAGAGWNDPSLVAGFGAPVDAALLLAVAVALAPRGRGRLDPIELALLPLWLVPLVRAIGLQPWRSELGLLMLVSGCGAALWSTVSALRATDENSLAVAVADGWLAAMLACIGLLSTAGVAAALYGVLAYGLGIGLLLRAPRLGTPVPLSAGFVCTWLAVGAIAASGAWLAATTLLIAALGSGLAAVIGGQGDTETRSTGARREARGARGAGDTGDRETRVQGERETGNTAEIAATNAWSDDLKPETWNLKPEVGSSKLATLLVAWFALGVLAPPTFEYLILPAVDLLQGGLTPFGLVAAWPWIGLAILDAGQRRVTTLPTIAAALLALVPLAGAWIVARLLARRSTPVPPTARRVRPPLHRVWWLGGRPRG